MDDARVKQIVLKDSAFQDTKRQFEALSETLCEGISLEDLEIFYKVLEQLQNNLEGEFGEVALNGKE